MPRDESGKFVGDDDKTVATVDPLNEDEIAAFKAELEEKDKAIAEKEAELEKLRPTAPIVHRLFFDADGVIAHFGSKAVDEMVQARIAHENKQRVRQGYDRLTYKKDEVAAMRETVIDEFVTARDTVSPPPAPDPITMVLKMAHPNGNIVQVPYEGQVNNIAGSLADGLIIYERKGFKRTEPFMCPAQDCWFPAAVIESGRNKGKWAFDGFCSEDHRDRTAKLPGNETPGGE